MHKFCQKDTFHDNETAELLATKYYAQLIHVVVSDISSFSNVQHWIEFTIVLSMVASDGMSDSPLELERPGDRTARWLCKLEPDALLELCGRLFPATHIRPHNIRLICVVFYVYCPCISYIKYKSFAKVSHHLLIPFRLSLIFWQTFAREFLRIDYITNCVCTSMWCVYTNWIQLVQIWLGWSFLFLTSCRRQTSTELRYIDVAFNDDGIRNKMC